MFLFPLNNIREIKNENITWKSNLTFVLFSLVITLYNNNIKWNTLYYEPYYYIISVLEKEYEKKLIEICFYYLTNHLKCLFSII